MYSIRTILPRLIHLCLSSAPRPIMIQPASSFSISALARLLFSSLSCLSRHISLFSISVLSRCSFPFHHLPPFLRGYTRQQTGKCVETYKWAAIFLAVVLWLVFNVKSAMLWDVAQGGKWKKVSLSGVLLVSSGSDTLLMTTHDVFHWYQLHHIGISPLVFVFWTYYPGQKNSNTGIICINIMHASGLSCLLCN